MPSPIVNATLHACLLTVISNVVGQLLSAYRHGRPLTLDWTLVYRFLIFMVLNCPLNFIWQSHLEESFPAHHTDSRSGSQRLHLRNTVLKFIIDQTLSSCVNTLFFSLTMASLQGASLSEAVKIAQRELWPIMTMGWKLWPAVSLLNYTVVRTVEMRSLVGSVAGMFWGIYLTAFAIH